MIGYVKHFDSNETISFTAFDSEPIYGDNDKYIKTKIKSYEGEIKTNFQNKEIAKENALYKFLSLMMLESVIRVTKKYYPHRLLEESKYKGKNRKWGTLLMMI